MKVRPMGMLLMMLAGWINRHQQDVIVKIRVSLVQVVTERTTPRPQKPQVT
jgi:hypothetical protein